MTQRGDGDRAAYKLSPPRALHHGTLLINVDMTALSSLLNPNKLKLQVGSVAEVSGFRL